MNKRIALTYSNAWNNKLMWWLVWVAANIVGFTLGEYLGGRDGLPKLLSEITGLHSLLFWAFWGVVYGLMFGTLQAFALKHYVPALSRKLWAVATALGFAGGVTVGAPISFFVAHFNDTLASLFSDSASYLAWGIVFGIVVGSSLGITQWYALRGILAAPFRWFFACIATWIVGESVAFWLGFKLYNTPVVGAVIGALSGILFVLMWPTHRSTSE